MAKKIDAHPRPIWEETVIVNLGRFQNELSDFLITSFIIRDVDGDGLNDIVASAVRRNNHQDSFIIKFVNLGLNTFKPELVKEYGKKPSHFILLEMADIEKITRSKHDILVAIGSRVGIINENTTSG